MNRNINKLIIISVFVSLLAGCSSSSKSKESLIASGCIAARDFDWDETAANLSALVAIDPGYINATNGALQWANTKGTYPWTATYVGAGANELAYIEYWAFRALCAGKL